MKTTPCGRSFEHPSHGGPTATRDATCDGQFVVTEWQVDYDDDSDLDRTTDAVNDR